MIVIITSCYSNGSEGPHRSHRTDRPRRSLSPNGISVGAAVFVAGGHAQRRHTDRQTTERQGMRRDRPRLCCALNAT